MYNVNKLAYYENFLISKTKNVQIKLYTNSFFFFF